MPQISLSRFALLLGIVLAVFFIDLGSARLWDRDEPRNARASHEMLERGDWIVPTFNGSLRDHKPILLYWSQMSSYLAFGESEFTARLPSALAALLSVVATAWLASRLSGLKRGISREGFWAAGVLATCLLFVMAGRAATPDALLIAFSTLGIAFLVVGTVVPSPPYSIGRVGKTRWLYAGLGYGMLGVAALAKGPVGIILPLAVVHLWWLLCYRTQTKIAASQAPQPRSVARSAICFASEVWSIFCPWRCCQAIWSLRVIPGVLVCLAVAAPWYVLVGMETEGAFLRGFFWEHNLGRAMQSMEGHNGSVLYYPAAFLVGTFPWSLWLLPVLIWCFKARNENPVTRQMLVLSGSWVAVYLLAFSCASTKLPSYITPCYAGAALAVAGYLRQFESRWSLPAVRWRYASYTVAVTTGIGIATGITWLSFGQAMPNLRWVSAGGVVVMTMGVLAFGLDRLRHVAWVPSCWLAAAALFQVALFGFGATTIDGYRDELDLLTSTDREAPSDNWLAIGGMEPSWVHYLGKPITEVSLPTSDPRVEEIVGEFLAAHPDARVIATGDETIESVRRWINDGERATGIEVLASGRRFLRSAELAVFGSQDTIQPGQTAEDQVIKTPHKRVATQPADAKY